MAETTKRHHDPGVVVEGSVTVEREWPALIGRISVDGSRGIS
jgi:hypothetical protein